MLKMLVADDDRLLRESISQLIDWKKHGIEVCALARSGDEVLSLLRKFCPDILLTDIEMPSPNGIALLRAVSEAKLPCKVIFLSAYSKFSYAQDAVRYGAFGYLLKPVNEEHLIQTVTACREEILASNKERLALRQCERFQADSLENDLKALLLAEKSVQADLPGACLRLFGTQALCAASLLVRQSALDCPTPEPPAGLQCYKVAIAQELLFLFLLPSGQEAALDAYLTRYAQILRREVPEAVCARSLVYACTESWRLYPECSLSRLLPVFSDGALPADYQALHRYAQQQPQETDGSAALLERLDHDSSQITPVLRSLFLSFARSGVFYDLHGSKLLCISFLDSFGRTGNPFSCSADEWESDFMLSFKKAILTSQNLESLYDVMLRILHRLFDRADGPAQPKSKLVADTLRYIQENYPSACLTEAANRAFVSPSYLSKLFASEMQVSFSRYLMCYRIGIAKKLLQGNGSKLYEIALSVGYSDVAHLSKAFKTIEGISPGQYKAQLSR